MNMSYCKFQNTRLAFKDCLETLKGMEDHTEQPLSTAELMAAKALATQAFEFVEILLDQVGMELAGVTAREIAEAMDNLQENARTEKDDS